MRILCGDSHEWNLHTVRGLWLETQEVLKVKVSSVTVCIWSRETVGTGLSVLWVAYANHSTLKPVPTLPQ